VSVATEAERRPRRFATWATVGIVGIALGILAFWVALPPVEVRTAFVPMVVGAMAALLGVGALTRGERRIGWGAVASGVIGMAAGAAATQASAQHLDDAVRWSTLVSGSIWLTTVLVFAAIGGMFSERSGVVNIGLEGMMLMGAFFGAWGADRTGSWWQGVLIGMVAGGLLALVHGVFCIHLRADQIVVGTAIIFLAYGITGFLYNDIYGDQGTPGDLPRIPDVNLDWLGSIPPDDLGRFLEESLGDVSVMSLVALGLVFVSYIVLFKTPLCLRIRACGEHPRAADTVGINVYGIRYGSVVLSGVLAALGGVYLSIGYNGSFTEKMTAGYGFIALAALIFGNWRPFGVLAAALLFGFANAVAPELENVEAWGSYATLFGALPYVITIVAVAGVIGRSVPPAAVGRPYVRQ
jgi:general nucleoside transport system permease protein